MKSINFEQKSWWSWSHTTFFAGNVITISFFQNWSDQCGIHHGPEGALFPALHFCSIHHDWSVLWLQEEVTRGNWKQRSSLTCFGCFTCKTCCYVLTLKFWISKTSAFEQKINLLKKVFEASTEGVWMGRVTKRLPNVSAPGFWHAWFCMSALGFNF